LKYKKAVGLILILVTVVSLVQIIHPVDAATVPTGTISALFKANGSSSLTVGPTADLSIGQQVTVDLNITGASSIWNWAVPDINWNPGVLRLIEVNEGNFLKRNSSASTMFFGTDPSCWKQTLGKINGGISDIRIDSSPTKNTFGNLATLVFEVIGYGTSDIKITGQLVNLTDYPFVYDSMNPTVNNATLTSTSTETTYALTVASAYGVPQPYITYAGTTSYNSGTAITCNVTSPVVIYQIIDGRSYKITNTCTGWTGTGSVPLNGVGTSMTFLIDADSSITWNWIVTGNTSDAEPLPTPLPSSTPEPSLARGTISVTFATTGSNTMSLSADSIGTQFIVDVNINDAQSVHGWAFDLNWNPAVIQLVSVTDDSFLSSNPVSSVVLIGSNPDWWNNVTGTTQIGETRMPLSATSNLGGAICHLEFQVVGRGDAGIRISNGKVIDIYAVPAGSSTNSINLLIGSMFQLPEYPFGAILALVTCFAGVLVFKKTVNRRTLIKPRT
jgi:hypothetical protein